MRRIQLKRGRVEEDETRMTAQKLSTLYSFPQTEEGGAGR